MIFFVDLVLIVKEMGCLYASRLNHMRGDFCILCDKYFLTTVIDYWCDETNIFHFPTGEITITLIDIHHILQVVMKGTLIERATLSMEDMEK